MKEAVALHWPAGSPPPAPAELGSADILAAGLSALRAPFDPGDSPGKLLGSLFEAAVEPHLIQPTFIYDYPTELSPLSKRKPGDASTVERFELYIGGMEIANAYSELNDPVEQYERFQEQLRARGRGDDEAHAMDLDYIRALCYGMPPTAGEGIGIDRLTMVLTNSRSIRDVVLFPLLRPEEESEFDSVLAIVGETKKPTARSQEPESRSQE
jgi:lysyl-tRNA synthetase class 2